MQCCRIPKRLRCCLCLYSPKSRNFPLCKNIFCWLFYLFKSRLFQTCRDVSSSFCIVQKKSFHITTSIEFAILLGRNWIELQIRQSFCKKDKCVSFVYLSVKYWKSSWNMSDIVKSWFLGNSSRKKNSLLFLGVCMHSYYISLLTKSRIISALCLKILCRGCNCKYVHWIW